MDIHLKDIMRYTYNDGRIKVGIWDGDIFSEVLDSQ